MAKKESQINSNMELINAQLDAIAEIEKHIYDSSRTGFWSINLRDLKMAIDEITKEVEEGGLLVE